MSNSFSPSTMLDMALAPTALLTTLLTSAVDHAPLLALLRIDAKLQVRRSADVEDAHVADSPDFLQDVLGLLGQQLQLIEVRSEDLE